jgi:rSAM/selenodomain-associated transferase 2
MISVVVPTLNADETLASTLAALVPAAVEGLVREVVIVDGGSSDRTQAIAEGMGARWLMAPRGRGAQLAAGACAAGCAWLLFLHADTVLEPGWIQEAGSFIDQVERATTRRAAAFRFALDDKEPAARRIEFWARARGKLLKLPYGDQGLLISRDFYDALGGYRALPLMEDVDLVRRIGGRRLKILNSRAITSAVRYRRGGYWLRPWRNLALLTLYFLRVPTSTLAKLYD